MDSPLVHAIRSFPWQVLAHLTFKRIPTHTAAEKMTNAFLRSACRLTRTHIDAHCSVVRGEFGELGHRFHEHVLIGNLKPPVYTTAFRMRLRAVWTGSYADEPSLDSIKWGKAQVWPYVSSLNGVDYVLKGVERYEYPLEAQGYEVMKFGLTDRVTFSGGLNRRVRPDNKRDRPETVETPRQKLEPDASVTERSPALWAGEACWLCRPVSLTAASG